MILYPSQVGQRHGGFIGLIQKACSLAQTHIWFERKVAEDRQMVSKRYRIPHEESIIEAVVVVVVVVEFNIIFGCCCWYLHRLKEHCEDDFNNPILIFPEGK